MLASATVRGERWAKAGSSLVVGLAGGLALTIGWNVGQVVRADDRSLSCLLGACGPRTSPEEQLLALVDTVRVEAGCVNALQNADLATVARSVALNMVADATTSPGSRTALGARASAIGYAGETEVSTAVGLAGPQDVVAAWSAPGVSPAAAARLRRCDLREVGAAYVDAQVGPRFGRGVWVLVLGTGS